MRWIATAGIVWGVVLGAINGPVLGGAVLAAGVLLVVVTSIVANRAARAARAALAEAAQAADEDRDETETARVTTTVLYPAVAGAQVSARLVQLLIEPTASAGAAAPVASIAERTAMLAAWNAGDSLAALAARTGLSEWTIGRLLLDHVPEPADASV